MTIRDQFLFNLSYVHIQFTTATNDDVSDHITCHTTATCQCGIHSTVRQTADEVTSCNSNQQESTQINIDIKQYLLISSEFISNFLIEI